MFYYILMGLQRADRYLLSRWTAWFCVEPFLSSGFRIRPVPDASVSGASGPSVPRAPLAHMVPLVVAFVGTLCPGGSRGIGSRKREQNTWISITHGHQKKKMGISLMHISYKYKQPNRNEYICIWVYWDRTILFPV